MRTEEWEEIKRILESALKDSERSNFLGACDNRPNSRQPGDQLPDAHYELSALLDDTLQQIPAVFQPGQLVAGRFRIVRLISRGGMGEVYETFDERLSIRLALKTLRSEFASNAAALERFRREIRVTRDFGHPNLCRVYELVEHRLPPDESRSTTRVIPCLTMQLVSGETLQRYLARAGPLKPEAALPLIEQIADAIAALHANGIIHRDLKPSNIMITPASDGELRAIVMDFGLAKPFATNQDAFESKSDFLAGAPFYIAPEVITGGKPSVASDIYAFGLIIDGMVTEDSAFSGETIEAILYQKLWGEPKDPLTRARELPANWARTISRCLDRDPAARFGCIEDVVRELTTPSVGTAPSLKPHNTVRALTTLTPKLRRLRSKLHPRTLVLGSAALIVATTASLYFIGTRALNISVVTFEFENLTGKAEYDYLCKGMTREVERRLLQLPGVLVIPYYEPRPKGPPIKTNARFSIEGQLEAGKRSPRLSVSIIENSTGTLICCANSFENDLADPLEMQGQITSAAVDAMRAAVLLPDSKGPQGFFPAVALFFWRKFPFGEAQKAGTAPTTSPVAMQTYMRAHALWEERTRLDSLKEAADLYKKAIAEDPKFVLAYSDLAGVERSLLQFNFAPRRQLLESAKSHALQAVSAGPDYPEAYAALAVTSQYSWDWRSAEQNYKRAIEINPKIASIHRQYGGMLVQFGKFDEGLREVRTAVTLDPYDNVGHVFVGTYLHYAGRPAEAVALVQGLIAQRDIPVAHNILGYSYAHLALEANGPERNRLLDRALKEADILAKVDATYQKPVYAGISVPMYSLFYALRGDKEQAMKYLNLLLTGEKYGAVNPIDIASPYVALGNQRAALDVLHRAVEAKDSGLLYMKVDPFLDPLRSLTEFKGLLTQAGLN